MRDPASFVWWFLLTAGGAECGREAALEAAYDPRAIAARAREGCVGFARDGRHALLAVTRYDAEGPRVVLAWAGFGEETQELAAGSPELAALLANHPLVPCHTIDRDQGPEVRSDLQEVAVVTATRRALVWVVDEQDQQGPGLYYRAGPTYGSLLAPHLYTVLDPEVHEGDDDGFPAYEIAPIDVRRVGLGPCVAPVGDVPLASAAPPAPPPFDVDAVAPHCLAMTADGYAAAFLVREVAAGRNTTAVRWYGAAGAPVDLGCLARGCTPDERARVRAAAVAAGLTACRALAVGDAIELGGRLYDWTTQQPLGDVVASEDQGGFFVAQVPHLEPVLFQRPGGPLFVAGLGLATREWLREHGGTAWFRYPHDAEPGAIEGTSAGPGSTVLAVEVVDAAYVGVCAAAPAAPVRAPPAP